MERWSPFLTTQAIEEGKLALAVGDTTGALDVFRRVMRRRPTPENGVEPSRAALQSLIEHLSGAQSN
jgi:hypothetical protein